MSEDPRFGPPEKISSQPTELSHGLFSPQTFVQNYCVAAIGDMDLSTTCGITEGNLNSFLAVPSRYAPGTRMIISVQDVQFRADVIAFLRTLSDEPLPLP